MTSDLFEHRHAVGDRVAVTENGEWRYGTVVEVKEYGYVVKLDDGREGDAWGPRRLTTLEELAEIK